MGVHSWEWKLACYRQKLASTRIILFFFVKIPRKGLRGEEGFAGVQMDLCFQRVFINVTALSSSMNLSLIGTPIRLFGAEFCSRNFLLVGICKLNRVEDVDSGSDREETLHRQTDSTINGKLES